jgi:hypothetical protein
VPPEEVVNTDQSEQKVETEPDKQVEEKGQEEPQPEPEDKGSVETLVDVTAIDQEQVEDQPESDEPDKQVQQEPEKKVDEEPEKTPDTYKLLDGEFPDLDELEFDGFYENLEPRHLERMDPYSKRILHNLRIEFKKARDDLEAYRKDLDKEHVKRQQELMDREEALSVRERQMQAWVTDPKVQDMLKPDESGEGEGEPDPLTQEGQAELIKREVRAGLRQMVKPANEAWEQKDREVRFHEFRRKHPKEMNDRAFLKEMSDIIKSGITEEGGQSKYDMEDAFRLTKAKQLMQEAERNRAQALRARQESQKRIAKNTKSGTKDEGDIPLEVRKGGAKAIGKYLRENEKVHQKVRAKQGRL